jgi:hypothetical protein
MNNHTSIFKRVLFLVIVMSAFGFWSVAQAQVPVGLKYNSATSKLEVTTRGTCTSAPEEKGCVKANGVTKINFQLNGSPECTLQHVALNKPFPSAAVTDFKANSGTGIITPKNQSESHIMIEDRNTSSYTVNYTVTAKCDGKVVDSDPRIINDGTGNP